MVFDCTLNIYILILILILREGKGDRKGKGEGKGQPIFTNRSPPLVLGLGYRLNSRDFLKDQLLLLLLLLLLKNKNEKIRVTLCENAAGALYIVNKMCVDGQRNVGYKLMIGLMSIVTFQ